MTSSRPLLSRIASAASAVSDAFAWPLRTSHYLELVNPLWSTHALQARVEAVWDETADARTLTLRPGRNWRAHRAGQHLRVGVPIEGKEYTRTYSISSAPERQDECISITVKAIGGGRMSTHLVRNIQVGDYLPIGIPQGDLVLPDAMPVAPLFISAGSGITPIMSMLRSLIAQERLPHATHLHYAPHAHDVIFGSELRELASQHPRYKLELLYTRATSPRSRAGEDPAASTLRSRAGEDPAASTLRSRAGEDPAASTSAELAASGSNHFSAEQLERLCPDWRSREVYACGPQALLDALEAHFAAAGLEKRLHTERFRAKVAPQPTSITPGDVRFSRSKLTARSDGVVNLLRLAEDNGLNPPHGCRMGICHGCDATLRAGCVRDLRTNTLHSEPGQTVQICVCAAAGDAELEL